MDDHAEITTTAALGSTGGAGKIFLGAGAGIVLNHGAAVNSRSLATVGNAGAAGSITIGSEGAPVDYLHLLNGGNIGTTSANARRAGIISIYAGDLLLSGVGVDNHGVPFESQIATANEGSGAAGDVVIHADNITFFDGAQMTTNSGDGRAGNISLHVSDDGLLVIEGERRSTITTSSTGDDGGGVITIDNPLAVISDGARILALGPAGGANVHISSAYWIQSFDRLNELSVNGALVLDSSVQDVSRGVETPDISFLDVSRALRGQCPEVHARGETSQLASVSAGPYLTQTDDRVESTAEFPDFGQCRP